MKIPRVGARLECMQYKVGFDSNLNEVKEAVDCVALACQALMNDEAFKQLLMVLRQPRVNFSLTFPQDCSQVWKLHEWRFSKRRSNWV